MINVHYIINDQSAFKSVSANRLVPGPLLHYLISGQTCNSPDPYGSPFSLCGGGVLGSSALKVACFTPLNVRRGAHCMQLFLRIPWNCKMHTHARLGVSNTYSLRDWTPACPNGYFGLNWCSGHIFLKYIHTSACLIVGWIGAASAAFYIAPPPSPPHT